MRRRRSVLLALFALLPSCREETPAPPHGGGLVPPASTAPALFTTSTGPAPITRGAVPVIDLGAEGYTCERENPWRSVELDVTVTNPTDEPLQVAWDRFQALADGLMGRPSWSVEERPERLGPGAEMRSRVSWGYPSTEHHPLPDRITVVYRPDGMTEAFRREVPVRVLPTEGVRLVLVPPAWARPSTGAVPDVGPRWEVSIEAQATNSTSEPIMYVPRFAATVVQPEGTTRSGVGWLGTMTRLGAGESVRGSLGWTFYGDAPAPERIRVSHVIDRTVSQEAAVVTNR